MSVKAVSPHPRPGTSSRPSMAPPTSPSTSPWQPGSPGPTHGTAAVLDTPLTEPASAVLTVDEVAALLRLNRKTIYEAFQRGDLPGGRRLGRSIRFDRATILAWLAAGDGPPRRRAHTPAPPGSRSR